MEKSTLNKRTLALVFLSLILNWGCSQADSSGGVLCPDGMVGDGSVGGLCIDAFELTNAQARDFLNNNGSLNDCDGHECFFIDEPGSQLVEATGGYVVAAGFEEFPVVQVTWYGAAAMCEWMGKRLCAAIEWQNACGGEYPYGESYAPQACNGMDLGQDAPVAVGSLSSCEGGIQGLFDMSGNVYEWTEACSAGDCPVYGGSFSKPEGNLGCEEDHQMDGPSGHRDDLGLRCCLTP